MKFTAGEWVGATKIIATYNYHHDVVNSLGEGIRPVAHISYTKGKKKGGVDVFLDSEILPINKDRININKEIKISPKTCLASQGDIRRRFKNTILETEVIEQYDVRMQIKGSLSKEIKDQIKMCALTDIAYFCQGDIAKEHRGSKIEEVDKIVPITKVKEVEAKRLIDGGKQWFVPECLLGANIDFGKGCIASFIPGETPQLLGDNLIDWYSAPWAECGYPCYASRMHKPFPKTVHKIDPKRLEALLLGEFCPDFGSDEPLGRLVDILRFGKRTESYNLLFKDNFMATLGIMAKTGTRGVIPTKFLPFDKEIAKLLKQTKSVVLYGVGFDELEKGAVMNGCSNEWRLEQMIKYNESGVRAYPYLHILADAPPTQRDKEIMKLGYPTQLLPLRFKDKKTCYQVSGRGWDELKRIGSQHMIKGFVPETAGHEIHKRWSRAFVHSSWLKIIGKNNGRIRMCHHNSKKTYCGGCFQGKGKITNTRVGIHSDLLLKKIK